MKNNYASYVKMPKHPGFYQNLVSKKIMFIKSVNGNPVRIACKTTSITEAKAFVNLEMIRLFAANPNDEIRKKKGITNPSLSEIWQDLVDERALAASPATARSYKTSWEHGIEGFWGDLNARDVSPIMVTKFENWYLKHYPDRVFFNTKKHLTMLFRYMVKQSLLIKAPEIKDLDKSIVARTKKKKVGRVYTNAEIQSLITSAVDQRTKTAIMIYRFMGARKNEILSAEQKNWDLKKQVANIWSSKNKKWREVQIPTELIPEIEHHLSEQEESEYLFCSPSNPATPMAPQVFDKYWMKTKIAANLKDAKTKNGARVHDLRHTFATLTAQKGWPVMVACKVLDMSASEYERTYVHISADDIRDKMNSIGMELK